uniref:Major facilitator superfamily (MFS) profile domain-containing protein n=1 Tax=Panagrolaimus davidi TaxID=227884 RepID=A0A914PI06_9BILA
MKYFGRKTLIISSLFLQGILIAGYPYVQEADYIWFAITLNLLGKLSNGIIQVVHPVIVTEMLPTKMRTMIYSVVNIPQSFGILLAPYLKYTSTSYSPTQYLILSGLSFIGMGLAFILPETKGKSLPENVQEMDHGPLGKCFGRKNSAEKN